MPEKKGACAPKIRFLSPDFDIKAPFVYSGSKDAEEKRVRFDIKAPFECSGSKDAGQKSVRKHPTIR